MRVKHVLIVGAGLSGLALACGLSRAGIGVTLVEKRPRNAHDGAAILLTGNAMRALDALGVAHEVYAAGHHIDRVRFTDHMGMELFEVACQWPDWPPFLTIERSVLRQAMIESASLTPRYGVTIEQLHSHGGTRVELSDGSTIDCDLVVGADGLRSRVRELLFPTTVAQRIGEFTGFRFVVDHFEDLIYPTNMLGNGLTLLLYPLPGQRVYVAAGPIAPVCLASGRNDLDLLQATFRDFGGPASKLFMTLDEHTELLPTHYWQVEQAPWHLGRCVLIGDAAHASAPTLAQGGAMAFEDAQVLIETLANESNVENALKEFEVRRWPRVRQVQRDALERMDANNRVGTREHRLRQLIFARMGGRRLTDVWSRLIEELP